MRVVAVDKDSGDNGRVSYVITAGNEEARFTVGYESGIVSLAKPMARPTDLEITANDHGTPPRKATLKLSLTPSTVQTSGPPRLLLSNPIARISEDLQVGATVLNVVGPAIADQGEREGLRLLNQFTRDCKIPLVHCPILSRTGSGSTRKSWPRSRIKLLSV